jgi:type I restriction enzyme S subunit
MIRYLENMNNGGAVPLLNLGIIRKVLIPRPTVKTQKHIASFLSAYDDLIENNRRRIQLLEQAARLLYKEWFVHLRFPGHEHTQINDGVPEVWVKKTAFEVMDVLSGGTPKTTNPSYWDGDIPFFTPKDATDFAYAHDTDKSVTEAGLKNCNSNLYPKGTVFITARGTVGKINLAQRPMAMNQSCYALVAHPPLNQQFLYFALVDGVEQFRSRAVGAVFDAIVRDTFKLIPFVVPDEKLITAFMEHVSPMLAQIDNLAGQVLSLRKARDLLLPKLMNGEVAV